MKKQIASSKWIALFFAIVILAFLLMSAVVYAVDPLLQYRIPDNTYYEIDYPCFPGLAKNYDYDTLVIGSSMTQNFDMDLFRERFGARPLRVGWGGIKRNVLTELVKAAYSSKNAQKFYICADPYHFYLEDKDPAVPEYLCKDDVISRCRYFLSHEVWTHYLPENLRRLALRMLGKEYMDTDFEKSIKELGYWGDSYVFGEDVVIENYRSGAYSTSEVDTKDLFDRMRKNIDEFLSEFDYDEGKHIFFFPPYSSLYWCITQQDGYFNDMMKARHYFVEKAAEYNVTVYDFQAADFTVELDNYKDTTHYRPEINDWMVECFADGSCIATTENYNEFQEKLIANTESFRAAHADLFD